MTAPDVTDVSSNNVKPPADKSLEAESMNVLLELFKKKMVFVLFNALDMYYSFLRFLISFSC